MQRSDEHFELPTTGDHFIANVNKEDVIYGRGNHIKSHPGNIHYRSLVQAIKEYYAAFNNDKKKMVSALVYESIHGQNPPGRFLVHIQDRQYVELDMENSIRRISQCFREKQPSDKASASFTPKRKMSDEETDVQLQKMRVRFTIVSNRNRPLYDHDVLTRNSHMMYFLFVI